MSWCDLVKMMQNPVMTFKLGEVKFPEYDWKTVTNLAQKNHDPTVHLDLFDSNINIEFVSTEPQPRQVKIAAKGRPATLWNAANGSSVKAVRSLIKNCKPGSDIKRLVMVGTLWTRVVNLAHQYKNPLRQIGLANPEKLVNLTCLKLRDYNCECLPKDLFRSVNLSSVKEMAVAQCSNLLFLWELFLTSRFLISITKLTVDIYDWGEYLMGAHAYGFESFCRPWDIDGTSAKPDPGSDGTSEETMYRRLSDRILEKIRKVASKNGVAQSKVATVLLHDKALIGEYDPLPGKDRHFKREYKYHGTSAKIFFLD